MGHKVHPTGFRIGVIRDWQSKWYADKHYGEFVREDFKLRDTIQSQYREAGISQVEINRQANEVFITINTARPGVVIGRGGQRVDEMRLRLEKLIGKRVRLNIMEIQQPELDATLVARTVAEQMERRIAYRRAMKQAISRSIQAGAKGVRISCAGRLGGAEIARRLTMHDGQLPLHTLRADIDYGFSEARTTLGRIGVKTWIYKGDILPEPKMVKEVEEVEEAELAVSEKVEPATAAALVETPHEPEAEKSLEAAPVAKSVEEVEEAELAVSEKVEPATAAALVETPHEPEAERSLEAAPVAKSEEKPVKPRTRRAKKTPSAEPEENTVKPTVDITTTAESSTTAEEEKDATTETGEIPQES